MMPIQLNPEFARQVRLAEVGRKMQKQAARPGLLNKMLKQPVPARLAQPRQALGLPGSPPNVKPTLGEVGVSPTRAPRPSAQPRPTLGLAGVTPSVKPIAAVAGAPATQPFTLPSPADLSLRPAGKLTAATPSILPPQHELTLKSPAASKPNAAQPINPINPGTANPQAFSAYAAANPVPTLKDKLQDGYRSFMGDTSSKQPTMPKLPAAVDPVTGLPNLKPVGIAAGAGLGAGVGGAGLLAMTRDGKAQAAAVPPEATPDATTPPVTPTPPAGPGEQVATGAVTTPPAGAQTDPATGQPVTSPVSGTTPGATGLKEGLEAATGKDATPQMAQPVIDFVTSMLPENIGQMLKAFSDKHGANMTVGGVSLGLIGLMLLLQNMFGKSGAAIPWKPKATNYKRVPTGRFMSANGTIPVPKGPGKTILPSPLSSAVKTGLLSIKRK